MHMYNFKAYNLIGLGRGALGDWAPQYFEYLLAPKILYKFRLKRAWNYAYI